MNLVNDMMDLAKMKENKFKFDMSFFDLKKLISNSLKQVSYQAKQKKITLKEEIRRASKL